MTCNKLNLSNLDCRPEPFQVTKVTYIYKPPYNIKKCHFFKSPIRLLRIHVTSSLLYLYNKLILRKLQTNFKKLGLFNS